MYRQFYKHFSYITRCIVLHFANSVADCCNKGRALGGDASAKKRVVHDRQSLEFRAISVARCHALRVFAEAFA
jgi:hypothetical protein